MKLFIRNVAFFSEKTQKGSQALSIGKILVTFPGNILIWIHFWQENKKIVLSQRGHSVRICQKMMVNHSERGPLGDSKTIGVKG